ncbi:hypothetical protein SDRG_09997 [Saprolegnia diclina VS20]|uniref:Uncharacterized protein n=1 Tax=Saprolegnia diclina (strain VS20) TaxID=1156394 RepID=T0RQB4_SAPDV|nr:hypothetical protein SDRG_09997 [Saprolegnia diclina VS20]EQC32247.1 hypothetical protein SDRG_09997 [Saprolegnia diclina VS20]|eukprot:XP_008614188.1 hypothetical protein SDRG_09997 [Saprolegnia diclina VS20]
MTEKPRQRSSGEHASMQDDALDARDASTLQRQPTPSVGDDTEHPQPPNVLQIEWTDDDLRGLTDITEEDARRNARATQAPLLQAGLEHRHRHKPSLRLGAANKEVAQLNRAHGGVSLTLMVAAVAMLAFITLKVVLHRRRRFQQYQPID